MADEKLKFNPETLDYENTAKSKARKIIEIIVAQIVGAILVAAVIFIAFSYVLETPKQRKLKREIIMLEKQYNELLIRRNQQEKYMAELKEKDRTIYKEIFQSEIATDSSNTTPKYVDFQNINIKKSIKANKERIKIIDKELKELDAEYKRIIQLAKSKQDEIRYTPAIQPIYNKDLNYPVSGFGKRIDQLYKSPVFHPGIDYAAPEGTKIYATADGVVTTATEVRRYGMMIVIDHGKSYKTRYAHMSKFNVSVGKRVKRGDVIGFVGNTGKSLTPHLHYEVIYNNKEVNPVNYFFLDLNPEEYFKIKYMADRTGLSLD